MTRFVAMFGLCVAVACPHASATTRVEDTTEQTATVKDVDLADRLVILERHDGSFLVVSVDPSIHRLEEIRTGETVHIKYTRAMAVTILKSKDAGLSTTVTPSYQRSEGSDPKATSSQQIRAIVRIDGIDLANYTVTSTGESGAPEIVYLFNPELQNSLSKLKLGDIAEIVYSEATVEFVTPATDL